MKKLMILSLFLVIFLVGCGKEAEQTKYEELMYAQAKQYYEKHGKPLYEDSRGDSINIELNNYSVSIGKMKEVNAYGGTYDLTGLEDCKDETQINLTIDQKTLEIQSYTFVNKCE